MEKENLNKKKNKMIEGNHIIKADASMKTFWFDQGKLAFFFKSNRKAGVNIFIGK